MKINLVDIGIETAKLAVSGSVSLIAGKFICDKTKNYNAALGGMFGIGVATKFGLDILDNKISRKVDSYLHDHHDDIHKCHCEKEINFPYDDDDDGEDDDEDDDDMVPNNNITTPDIYSINECVDKIVLYASNNSYLTVKQIIDAINETVMNYDALEFITEAALITDSCIAMNIPEMPEDKMSLMLHKLEDIKTVISIAKEVNDRLEDESSDNSNKEVNDHVEENSSDDSTDADGINVSLGKFDVSIDLD